MRRLSLDSLDGPKIPSPLTFDTLCDSVATWRNRALRVELVSLGGEITGLWAALADEDLVLIEESAPLTLQLTALAHEVGHMIMRTAHAPSVVLAQRLPVGGLIVGADVERAFARSVWEDRQELEAEVLAMQILRSANRPPDVPRPTDVAGRIRQVFA